MQVQFDIKCTVNLDLNDKDSYYYEEYRNRINKMSNDELKELLMDHLRCCEMTARCELNCYGFFDNIQISQINIVNN